MEAEAVIRLVEKAQAEQSAQLESIEAQLAAMNANAKVLSFREKTIRDSMKAGPSYYVVEIAFALGATQRTPVTFQTDARGWFFAERLWMSWRPTTGAGLAGHWQPLTSDSAPIARAYVAAVPPPQFPPNAFDFYWEYSEGSANLTRQSAPIPGTILYRDDFDGIIPGSDGWAASTSVTFYITPLGVGPATAGVFNITVGGIQCYHSLA